MHGSGGDYNELRLGVLMSTEFERKLLRESRRYEMQARVYDPPASR